MVDYIVYVRIMEPGSVKLALDLDWLPDGGRVVPYLVRAPRRVLAAVEHYELIRGGDGIRAVLADGDWVDLHVLAHGGGSAAELLHALHDTLIV